MKILQNIRQIKCKHTFNPSKTYEYLLILFMLLMAIILRISLIPFPSQDYYHYFSKFYDFIQTHGGFAALKYNFSDYNPPYLYLIALVTYIPLSKIAMIKAIAIVFDFLLAFIVYLIVKLKYNHHYLPLIAAFIVLFTPTIFLNSSFWGQSDVIYTTFSLGCVYFLLLKKPIWAFIFFGIAISFKLQAIFILPLLLYLLLANEIPIKYFLLIPLVYLILLVPALLMGRPLLDLLSIYVRESHEFPTLTLNAPNFYQWLSNSYFSILNQAGIIFTAGIVALLFFVMLVSRKKITERLIIKIAFIFVLVVPFFLPRMHERYFYLADVLSIIYACYFPRYFYLPVLVQIASFFSYVPYLWSITIIGLPYLALIVLGVMVIAIADLIKDLYFSEDSAGIV